MWTKRLAFLLLLWPLALQAQEVKPILGNPHVVRSGGGVTFVDQGRGDRRTIVDGGTVIYYRGTASDADVMVADLGGEGSDWWDGIMLAGWRMEGGENYTNTALADSAGDWAFATLNYPVAVNYDNRTYMGFNGYNDDPYVMYYDHDNDSVVGPFQVSDLGLDPDDDHGQPILFIDSSEYIHVIFGGHASPLRECVSSNPNDISSWENATVVVNPATYPQLIETSDGVMYLFYRRVSVTDWQWDFMKSSDDGQTWTDTTFLFGGYSYPIFSLGINDTINCVIVGDSTAGVDRKNIYYCKFDGTTWENIDKEELGLPITMGGADSILAYNSSNLYCPLAHMDVNSDNRPFIVFPRGRAINSDDDGYTLQVLKNVDNGWEVFAAGETYDDLFECYNNVIEYVDGDTLKIYTVNANGSLFAGDFQVKRSVNAAENWSELSVVTNAGFINNIRPVQNANNSLKVVFSDYGVGDNEFSNVIQGYGSGGLLGSDYTRNNPTVQDEYLDSFYLAVHPEVTFPSGKYGNAMYLEDDIDQDPNTYINDDDGLTFASGGVDSAFAISFWIKMSNTSTTQFILSKRYPASTAEYTIDVTSNTIRFYLLKQDATAYIGRTAPFSTTDTWVHFHANYDGSEASSGIDIFIDNVASDDADLEIGTYEGMANTASDIFVGSYKGDTYSVNTGYLDDLFFWNDTLSNNQRLKVMNGDF